MFLSQIHKVLATESKKVEKMMIYHCFFLHIDWRDWNVLHINYLFIFTCKMGPLLFSPLMQVIIRRSGEGFSVLVTQEASVFLPSLPARAAASELPTSSSYSNFILQSRAFCSSGRVALAVEAAQKNCARVSALSPAGPGSPTAGWQSNRQREAASTAALCSQETPFFWDSSVNVLPTLFIRTQFF